MRIYYYPTPDGITWLSRETEPQCSFWFCCQKSMGPLPLPGALVSGSVFLKIFVEGLQCTKLWDIRGGCEELRRGHEVPGAAQGEECISIDTL